MGSDWHLKSVMDTRPLWHMHKSLWNASSRSSLRSMSYLLQQSSINQPEMIHQAEKHKHW